MLQYTAIYYFGILHNILELMFLVLGILCFIKYLKENNRK
jgi:hypothetical protein